MSIAIETKRWIVFYSAFVCLIAGMCTSEFGQARSVADLLSSSAILIHVGLCVLCLLRVGMSWVAQQDGLRWGVYVGLLFLSPLWINGVIAPVLAMM